MNRLVVPGSDKTPTTFHPGRIRFIQEVGQTVFSDLDHNGQVTILLVFAHFLDLPHLGGLLFQGICSHAIDDLIQFATQALEFFFELVGNFSLKNAGFLGNLSFSLPDGFFLQAFFDFTF